MALSNTHIFANTQQPKMLALAPIKATHYILLVPYCSPVDESTYWF